MPLLACAAGKLKNKRLTAFYLMPFTYSNHPFGPHFHLWWQQRSCLDAQCCMKQKPRSGGYLGCFILSILSSSCILNFLYAIWCSSQVNVLLHLGLWAGMICFIYATKWPAELRTIYSLALLYCFPFSKLFSLLLRNHTVHVHHRSSVWDVGGLHCACC